MKLSFEEAKIMTAMLGFHSKREYQQAKLPKGLYKNPAQAYPDEFDGWDDYLGKKTKDAKKEEILDLISSSGIDSFVSWRECIKSNILCGQRFPKEISKTQFTDDVKRVFRLNKSYLPESAFLEFLKREGITELKSYKQYLELHRTNLPQYPTKQYGKSWSELIFQIT